MNVADSAPTNLDTGVDLRAHFIRRAGILLGAFFAIAFTLIMLGFDAQALRLASAHLWWGKLAIGFALILPVSILTGWLAAAARRAGLSILLWIITGAGLVWIVGHLPYEGLNWLSSLDDPYPNAQMMYPFLLPSAGTTGIAMVIGTSVGLLVGLLSLFTTNSAWERSTQANRFSFGSIVVLSLCVLPIVPLGPIVDNYLNASLRLAFVGVHQAIDTALDPQADLDADHLPSLKNVRDQLTPAYTLYWVTSSADGQLTTIDVQFESGLLLRCFYNFGTVGLCRSIAPSLKAWMTQLVNTASVSCADCNLQVDRATSQYLAVFSLTVNKSARITEVSLLKHLGGWLYERATFDDGRAIDCRFSGASPIVVDLCIEARP